MKVHEQTFRMSLSGIFLCGMEIKQTRFEVDIPGTKKIFPGRIGQHEESHQKGEAPKELYWGQKTWSVHEDAHSSNQKEKKISINSDEFERE